MNVPQVAADYKLIIVMPDVGNSWYVNWAENDAGQKNDWEDYIIKDLDRPCRRHVSHIASREGRAINGLSMGGYGAMMLGLRHPDMFCTIGSHTGALAFAERTAESIAKGEQPEFLRREWSKELEPEDQDRGLQHARRTYAEREDFRFAGAVRRARSVQAGAEGRSLPSCRTSMSTAARTMD